MASGAAGKVTVTTPGTAVQASKNLPNAPIRVGCQRVLFQALAGNAGSVYIEQGTGSNDRTNLTRTLAVLPKPAATGELPSFELSVPSGANGFNLCDYYIDADNGGDGVLISYVQG